jgi:pyruvate,water dikinase
MPFIGTAALTQQVGLEAELSRLERGIERELRGLVEMDLAILPNDAMATTLIGAQGLVERAAELWCRCASVQLGYQLALRAIIRRRIPDADPLLGYVLCAGTGHTLATSVAQACERFEDVLRLDPGARQELKRALATSGARTARDLPDGRARGALGHLLARHGELALGAFELSVPRWREDARDLLEMVTLLLDGPTDRPRVDELLARARALADRELARYEPELGRAERRLVRMLLDRCKGLLRARARVDRLFFRLLWALRLVVLDVDRRLRRLEPSLPPGGAFHCSADRLAKAFKSGRPELGRIIRMRVVEREESSREPVPPAAFAGSPPRTGIPVVPSPQLEGFGVSPGVVEGRVRIMHRALPERLDPGDVLVTTALDPAMAPLCTLAGAVVSEVGGALSLGAELARELSLPAVMSVHDARLQLVEGERVRVDGTRGVIERLEVLSALRTQRSMLPPPPNLGRALP